jgi:hypothetical protein
MLGVIRADRQFHLDAGIAWQAVATPHSDVRPIMWVTGELDQATAREAAWSAGAAVSVSVTASTGQEVASDQAALTTTARAFVLYLPANLPAGDYVVRAKVQGKTGGGAETSGQVRVTVPPPGAASAPPPTFGDALLFRRGPFTGPGFQPTADLRFRRAERLRLDVPLGAAVDAIAARVLDRKGAPLAIPATAGPREEEGRRLASVEIGLAPFAAGDYLTVTRGNRQDKALTAIRIVP